MNKGKSTPAKDFGRAVGRVILRILIAIIRVLPLSVGLAIGRGLGKIMLALSKKRYNVAIQNLKIAFGDTITSAERDRIARASFEHFGMFAIEVIKFSTMPQAEVERRFDADPEEFAAFEELMKREKGCICVTGHLGNFEVAGRWIVPRGYKVIALAREARDKGTTKLMMSVRERNGVKVLNLGRSMKPIFAGLKENALIAIVCDQNAADVFVPFFGQPTGTVDGPAKIALRAEAPMIFFYCVRQPNGRYKLQSHGYYDLVSTGDAEADVKRGMTEVNNRIEEIIRLYPEQWLWFHDRWKSSPDVVVPETTR
ncbi:MAG: lysophospholipid acyltransferase family protein [Chthonomonadales bacterium]